MPSRRASALARASPIVALARLATLARADQTIQRAHKLDDEFASSAMLRCESCAAVTHASMVHIDRLKARKMAMMGSSEVGDGEVDWAEACETRFAAGSARYGYKTVANETHIVGPGIDVFASVDGKVRDREGVTTQLYARCKALMYELNDFSIAETYAEAEAAVEKSGAKGAEKPTAVFMQLLDKNCVENVKMCESVDWFKDALSKSLEESTEAATAAASELYNATVDENNLVNITLANEKCNNEDDERAISISSAACDVLVRELLKKGDENTRAFHNFTGEATKYEKLLERGGEKKLDDDDVDKDGDVHELYADAMLNASQIKANITLARAAGYFSSALDIDSENYAARHNLAYAYKSAKNWTAAKDHLYIIVASERANDMASETRAESLKLLCEVEFHDKNVTGALSACRKGVELDQYNFHTLRLLAQIHVVRFFDEVEAIRATDEDDVQEERQHNIAHELVQALDLFTRALVLNPVKNEIAQLGMTIYFLQAAQDAALKKLTREQLQVLKNARHFCSRSGTDADSACADMLELAGQHMFEKGFIAIGNDALQMALVLDKARTQLWSSLGYGFMTIGKFKLAKVAFDKAKESDETFTLSSTVEDLFRRGVDFETKLDEDRATASASWTENRRPNKDERAELAKEVTAKLGAVRGVAKHDEL